MIGTQKVVIKPTDNNTVKEIKKLWQISNTLIGTQKVVINPIARGIQNYTSDN